MEEKNKKGKKPKKKQPGRGFWALHVALVSVALSVVLSLLSNRLLAGTGLFAAVAVLLAFIALGIVFDIIGVAVTAAGEKPFHSMAAKKQPGAREALRLIRSADKVGSFCNDVVGDICGIVSGTTVAVIAAAMQVYLPGQAMWISIAFTALASGLTIGGKALGKAMAIRRSTAVVYAVGRLIHVFYPAK